MIFYKTRSLTEWREAAEKNPFEAFEMCPLTDVRIYCIKLLRANYVLDINHGNWALECLRDVMFGHNEKEDSTAGEFLGWCLFCAEPRYLRNVLECVTTVVRMHPIYCPTITKVVCGYVRERQQDYFANHCLYDLFVTALKPLCTIYTITEWHAARRCLERINDVKDVRFSDLLRTTLASHQQGSSRLDHNEGLAVTHESCTATLEIVVRNLDGAIQPLGYDCLEARKDMSTVGSDKPNKHLLENARVEAHVFGDNHRVRCEECFRIRQSWLRSCGE